MFVIILPIVCACAILFEIVTWKYFIRRACGKDNRKLLKISYLIASILIWIIPIVSIYVNNSGNLGYLLWSVWLLITNIAIKKTATIVALVGWICYRKKTPRPKCIGISAWIAVTAIMLVMVYGATLGRTDIRIENVEIVSEKIPKSFNGYKIVQFSDLHLGNLNFDNDLVKRMVKTINELQPNLIVQSGDLINMVTSELTDDYIADLQKLSAIDGVVAVLGNHDLGFYIKDTTNVTPKQTFDEIRRIQNEVLGWQLLENESISLFKGDDFIDVAGVTYPKNLNHNNFNSEFGGSDIKKAFKGLNDSTFRVFITHTPKLFDSLPTKGRADLVLSGHVHNMQLAVNLFGKEISPAKLMYQPFSGLSIHDKMALYINDGMGYVLFPFRLGSKPEITVFTLKSGK